MPLHHQIIEEKEKKIQKKKILNQEK